MEHKFTVTGKDVEINHNLVLKIGPCGHVCVYCEKHGLWIAEFKEDSLRLDDSSCLFEESNEIDYTKSEEE